MFNTNTALSRYNGGGIGGGGIGGAESRRSSDVQVQYEIAVPFVTSYRHTPYHSLWDIHQW